MMNVEPLQIIYLAINLAVLGVFAFIWKDVRTVRTDNELFRKEVQKAVDKLTNTCTNCMLNLPKEYAPKDAVDKLWDRTDMHAERIAKVEERIRRQESISSC
jgi:hypothetical protein